MIKVLDVGGKRKQFKMLLMVDNQVCLVDSYDCLAHNDHSDISQSTIVIDNNM